MKTVIKTIHPFKIFLNILFFIGMGWATMLPSFAQDISGSSMNLPSAVLPLALPSSDKSEPANATSTPDTSSSSKNEKPAKVLEALDSKATASVKETIRKLENSGGISLDDLNTIRQMISKIDALIEAEKRLAELDKLRLGAEHENKSIAAAIPASAISPMPMPIPSLSQYTPSATSAPVYTPPLVSDLEILRIIGSGGHYVAVVKVGGQTKRVQVGDRLEGQTVINITATSIEFDQPKNKPTVYVKNVDTVFGSTR